ncbi:MAG: hypothetical protein E6J34_12150 [Chloroflexi bacterium]|nr:MAG: hypothetical protein E6J34_12150 [Chloroflexota bacterium]
MQFTVRSLGGKLVAFATLTLLLCMVLFALLSWGLLRFYAEQAAKSDAQAHLALLKRAYQAHTTSFVHNMDMVAGDPNVVRLVAQPSTPAIHDQLHDVLTPPFLRHRLTTLLLVAQDHHLLAQIGDDDSGATQVVALVDRALQKGMMVAVRQIALSDASQRSNDARWVLSVVLPLHTDQLKARYVLLASETVDDYFAQDLLQSTNTHVILCLAEHIEGEAGSAIKSRISAQHMPDNAICTGSAAPFIVNVGQRYLMLASTVDAPYQTSDSPSLAVVAVEPLFGIDARNPRMLFIILGMGLFIFALGVSIYTLCAWRQVA